MPRGGRRQGAGRPRKPTDVKVLQGTFRSDRHGDEAQPDVKGWPEPPAWLNARELELWAALGEKCANWSAPSDFLAFNGIVSLADRLLRNQEAQSETDTSGHPLAFKHVIKHAMGGDGNPVEMEIVSPEENPLITQEIKLWRELRAFIGITGLSPADRARMKLSNPESKKPANPLDRFLGKAK